MSHWEYYGEDQHKPDLKVILGDILKNTTDSRVYKRFEVILEEIERLEEKIKELEEKNEELENLNSDLESDKLSIEEKYTSLYDRISNALKE